MEHFFKQRDPAIFNRNNEATVGDTFNRFVDQAKGEIEAWSQRGSGWVIDGISAAFVNLARYVPLRGGSYMPLPAKLQNKKAIVNVQNRDNQCLRWALRAALFPPAAGVKVTRPSSYPTEDGLNFAGIDFPTPVSQIDKRDRQNPNLAINVFGWENDSVIVHRISEKDGALPRINLMLTQDIEKTRYSYVKRLTALLFDQSKNSNSKHFCERCLHGYTTKDLLERHKPECEGLLKRPTRTELPKEGENKVSFKNFHKQMKAPFVIYADFESLVRKIQGCKPAKNQNESFTMKTDIHEACGFSYIIERVDGEVFGPVTYQGEDAVYSFLVSILEEDGEFGRTWRTKRCS